ncbi:DUF6344 domain-containing protein [Streptomyces sp. NBC_00162]|uniref:DUF6344 domain-containing protein n=1 Tax=Streptomyces sp. NBC_00162 TaxID=2903629 RepID=UPI00214B0917|nr:DUF6344 domain-containing protein [Streptomyces sp. NBC_00162]UUU40964.1 DUF6344 domain-containing protein [Streptomyces sp. NBC_00162]
MAQRSILTSIWTSVLAALVALLGSLGFGGKAAPAAASVSAPAAPVAAVRRPAFTARRTWRAMMRGGSLPPTIKQRIRAEAHGKTPSVRRSTTAAAMGAGPGTAARALTQVGAPTGATAGVPAGAAREVLALAA